ncbi:MAG: hypothetical protein HY271_02145 [Deltaproteobacteria bacterium]|nr:hypothetical protein [Deltaproteobacteria bacterium]
MGVIARRYLMISALSLAVGAVGTRAYAQVCGDADGSGTVTVTDGVQALRAAAGLSSVCTLSVCDVDGGGTITVTDGVNILRKAAGLPSIDACNLVSAQAAQIIDQVRPFLDVGLGFIPGSGAAQRAAQSFENCDNGVGGTVEFTNNQVIFSTCQLGGVEFDGSITVGSSSVGFDLTVEDLATSESVDIVGQIVFRDQQTSATLGGSLGFFSNLGNFNLAFDNLTITTNSQGQLVFLSGSVAIAGATQQDLGSINRVDLVFDGSINARVVVTLDDRETALFNLDLNTGELTRV